MHHFIHKLYWKKLKNTQFLSKMACGHLLLMTSYLVTKLVSKSGRGINQQPQKTSGADGLSSGEKIRKTLLVHTSLFKTKWISSFKYYKIQHDGEFKRLQTKLLTGFFLYLFIWKKKILFCVPLDSPSGWILIYQQWLYATPLWPKTFKLLWIMGLRY